MSGKRRPLSQPMADSSPSRGACGRTIPCKGLPQRGDLIRHGLWPCHLLPEEKAGRWFAAGCHSSGLADPRRRVRALREAPLRWDLLPCAAHIARVPVIAGFGRSSASDTLRRMSSWWSQCPWGKPRPYPWLSLPCTIHPTLAGIVTGYGPPSASDGPRGTSGCRNQCPWGSRRPLRTVAVAVYHSTRPRIIIPARFLLFHGFWDFLAAFHGKMHNISGYAKSYLTITGFYGIICGSGDF